MNDLLIDAEAIDGVVELVWSTFDLPISRADVDLLAPPDADWFEARVDIAGSRHCEVVLHAGAPLARRLTQRLFRRQLELSADDLRDSLGEVANIIAGNIKSLMADEDGALSLPCVVQGGDSGIEIAGSELAGRFAYRSGEDPFVLTLHTRR